MIKRTSKRLNRDVVEGDIDALGYVMSTLQEVRRKQTEIELHFGPITQMYAIMDQYLPNIMEKEEQDARAPMVVGIPPGEAVERLKRFKEEFEVRGRKQEIYYQGEDLFGLPHQQYPQLDTIKEWWEYLWLEVPDKTDEMKTQIDNFAAR